MGLQASALRPLCLRFPAKANRCGADGFLYKSRIRAPDPPVPIPYFLSPAHPPSTAP